jgi:hypothetical protein
MKNDWTGNKKSTFITLGASNHTDKDRQREDYYATDPIAAKLLLEVEPFEGKIWECACGEKHLAKVFEDAGYEVRSSDIVDRCGNEVFDFLGIENCDPWEGNIVTNPPYKYPTEFIYKALSLIPDGYKVAMFLKLTFLEGQARRELFRLYPPRTVYVSSARLQCGKNGDFSGGSMVAYAWFIGEKGYTGPTYLKWIN